VVARKIKIDFQEIIGDIYALMVYVKRKKTKFAPKIKVITQKK
jgi:hypothetical protein